MIRKKNEGFTLVELLVTLGVMALVMAQIAALMIGCQNLYKKGSGEVNLQSESQRVIQVMEELLVDASVSVNTVPGVAPAAEMTVSSDMIDITTSANGVSVNYLVYLDKAEDEEFGELHLQSTIDGVSQPDEILAEYVESVSLNMANYNTADRVTLELAMNNGEYNYRCLSCKDIYLRNEIGSGGTKVAKNNDQTDYTIEVLRRKEYNLYELCHLDSSWSFEFEDESEAKLYYNIDDIKKVKCTNTLACSTGYKDDVAFVVKATKAGEADKTIKLKTPPVRVGIGKEGNSKGTGLVYAIAVSGGATSEYISYVDIQGISVGTLNGTDTSYDKIKIDFDVPSGCSGSTPKNKIISGSSKSVDIGQMNIDTPYQRLNSLKAEVDEYNNSIDFTSGLLQDGGESDRINMFKAKGGFWGKMTISYGGDSSNDLIVNLYVIPTGDDYGIADKVESMIGSL